ncbi:MAG TPA: DMT family transporter [Myxococcaceae bacterium]|nr:DMT family transporter [Myxococcaceae bacterium]
MAQVAADAKGGLGYMAASAFFFSIMALLVRVAGERLPSWQIVLARSVVALALSLVLVWRAGVSPWGNDRKLLLLRGLLGFGALACFYWSLLHMPLAEATLIQQSHPVFTALLAALFLREPLRAVDLASIGISLVGVLLVARPPMLFGGAAQAMDPAVVAVAICGALLSGTAYVVVRKARGLEHPLVVVLWFPLVATPLSLPPALFQWTAPTALEWLVLIGVGVSVQIAQVFMTHGLHRETASRATAMSYVQIVFAAVWGVVFLREVPDPLTIIGATLICGSVTALAAWPRRVLVPNPDE